MKIEKKFSRFKGSKLHCLVSEIWKIFSNNLDLEKEDCFDILDNEYKEIIIWSKDVWDFFNYCCKEAKRIIANTKSEALLNDGISASYYRTYDYYVYLCSYYGKIEKILDEYEF